MTSKMQLQDKGHNSETIVFELYPLLTLIFMPPIEEEGVYYFANVCRYVGRPNQMVSADYLQNDLSQSLHISHVDRS